MFNADEFVKNMILMVVLAKLSTQISTLDGLLSDGVIDEVEHAKQVGKANAEFVRSFDFAITPAKKEQQNG